jgi:uncharacterized protein YbjT (DUF2867 family)
MGKILVTGATGNIGSQLMLRLKEKNLEAIAGVSSLSKAGRFSKQSIDMEYPPDGEPEPPDPAGVDGRDHPLGPDNCREAANHL